MVKKRRLFLGRRAQAQHEILFTIFEVLVFAFFSYLLFAFVNDIENNTTFEKNYIARDLAITANTIYASPSSVVFKYPEKTFDFVIKIRDNLVKVKNEGQDDSAAIRYWYASESPDNQIVEDKFKDGEKIKLNKSLVSYSGADSFSSLSSSGSSGSTSPDSSGSCGEEIVSIAKQALGHPYWLGAAQWTAGSPPPVMPNCDKPLSGYEKYDYYDGTWKQLVAENNGKCTTDCASFTKWVYNTYQKQTGDSKFHISISNAFPQAKTMGVVVDHDPMKDWDNYENIHPDCNKLQKGDLIFFSQTAGGWKISHVGIYVGNCQYIHSGSPIQINSLNTDYAKRHYIGAKRVC